MGLDMHVYQTKNPPERGKTNSRDRHYDDTHPEWYDEEKDQELHYWRKHPDLHRWFENLYRTNSGNKYDKFDGYPPEDFECVTCKNSVPDCTCKPEDECDGTSILDILGIT